MINLRWLIKYQNFNFYKNMIEFYESYLVVLSFMHKYIHEFYKQ